MSMSTHVVGIRPADDRYKSMLAIYDSCRKLGISTPKEVDKFFNYETPEPNGVVVDIKDATTAWKNDYCLGLEVDVSKLPPDVKIIRFFNVW